MVSFEPPCPHLYPPSASSLLGERLGKGVRLHLYIYSGSVLVALILLGFQIGLLYYILMVRIEQVELSIDVPQ